MPPERVVTVLHLADFNLGRAPEGTREPVRLLDTLRRELDDRRDADGLSPDILVLSGNLSEHGRRDESSSPALAPTDASAPAPEALRATRLTCRSARSSGSRPG